MGQGIRARPSRRGEVPPSLSEKLWMRFRRVDGCWLWTGVLQPNGYGSFTTAPGKTSRAHRLVYELLVGSIPEGLTLDHLCRNRACVNPAHLEPVTMAENTRRGEPHDIGAFHRAKTHCPQGHPYSGENLYERFGRRYCRTCNVERTRAWRAARSAREVA